MNLTGLKALNKQNGFHWFDKKTMQFFDTKIHTRLQISNNVGSFIYSNQFPTGNRMFKIGVFDLTTGKDIHHSSDWFTSLDMAKHFFNIKV
jgi:hypothetical protein